MDNEGRESEYFNSYIIHDIVSLLTGILYPCRYSRKFLWIKMHDNVLCGQGRPMHTHNGQVCILQEPTKCYFQAFVPQIK